MVFEDLCDRPGGTQFLSLQDTASRAQLRSALSRLASLHAAFWGRPPLLPRGHTGLRKEGGASPSIQ